MPTWYIDYSALRESVGLGTNQVPIYIMLLIQHECSTRDAICVISNSNSNIVKFFLKTVWICGVSNDNKFYFNIKIYSISRVMTPDALHQQ